DGPQGDRPVRLGPRPLCQRLAGGQPGRLLQDLGGRAEGDRGGGQRGEPEEAVPRQCTEIPQVGLKQAEKSRKHVRLQPAAQARAALACAAGWRPDRPVDISRSRWWQKEVLMFARRTAALLALTASSLLLSLSCPGFAADDVAEMQVALKKGDRIIFFGDSL